MKNAKTPLADEPGRDSMNWAKSVLKKAAKRFWVPGLVNWPIKTMEHHHAINGNIHYKWSMFHSYVSLPEGKAMFWSAHGFGLTVQVMLMILGAKKGH